MINNDKFDTLFFFDKKRYPLRPILVDKNQEDGIIQVSVEPGTVVDIFKNEEMVVLEERKIFELKQGESLYIIADIDTPLKTRSGYIETYEIINGKSTIKKDFRYKVYILKYNIKNFEIKIEDSESEYINHSLKLCSNIDSNFVEHVFDDDETTPRFNQMYVSCIIPFPFDEGAIFNKNNPIDLPEPEENQTVIRLNYYFAWF